MPRRPRIAPGGLVDHVLNRAVALFEQDADIQACERKMAEAERKAIRQSLWPGTPFGFSPWQVRTAKRRGLEWTLRPGGRPRQSEG